MKNASFTLDGVNYKVRANESNGADSLHGGTVGYDQRNWTIVDANDTTITFMLFDDRFEGYPGRAITYATYSVGPGPSLTSHLVSIPIDAPTPIMLTTHPYFKLDAFVAPTDPTIDGHTLSMPYCSRYVDIDNIEVPTGQISSVLGGQHLLLDFTSPRTLGSSLNANVHQCGFDCTGIDTNFIINRPVSGGEEATAYPILTLSSNVTGIKFDLYTYQQPLIVYTCNKLEGTIPLKHDQQHAKDGRTLFAEEHGCVAIEA
jgi:aldose 1-epimerase